MLFFSPITLTTGTVSTNTSFALRVTIRTGENPCSVTLPGQVSFTTTGPSVTRAVFADAGSVCVGGATRINVSTEPSNDFEYTVFRRSTSANGLVADQVLGTFVGTAESNESNLSQPVP